jgi:O-antigen ligase/Flp pilus assembly protein TadD
MRRHTVRRPYTPALVAYADDALARQRWIVAVAVALAGALFWRGLSDPFALPKVFVLEVAAIAGIVSFAARTVRLRRLEVAWTPSLVVVGAFAVVATIATVLSEHPQLSLYGGNNRDVGLVLYLACVALFAVALHSTRSARRDVTEIGRAVLAASIPIVAYGLLEVVGVEPFEWGGRKNNAVFTTLGNANFAAAWLAIALPLVVWRVVVGAARERLAAAIVAVGMVVVAFATGSVQAPICTGVGVVVFAAVLVSARPELRARLSRRVVLALVVIVVGCCAVAAIAPGPFAEARHDARSSMSSRQPKWAIAVEMGTREPITGYGFAAYADWSRELRSRKLAASRDAEKATDAPHSVPLDLLAAGGFPLLLAYVAFVLTVLLALLRGLRHLGGEERIALGAVGASWLTYQVQSIVSIDEPSVAPMNWVLAGMIVALGMQPELRTFGREVVGRRRGRSNQTAPLGGTGFVLAAVGLVAALFALRPVRASYSLDHANTAAKAGDRAGALASFQDAVSTGTWDPIYPARLGEYLVNIKQYEAAKPAWDEALRRNERYFAAYVNKGRIAAKLGDVDDALKWYRIAIDLDPYDAAILAEASRVASAGDDLDAALELAQRARDTKPKTYKVRMAVAKALEKAGDEESALALYERALKQRPDDEDANKAVERLR